MMKRKLLITASTFPRWRNDTEPRFILDLAKAMSKYFDITVLAPAANGAKEKEMIEGIKVIRYHYLPVHKWETLCYPGAIVPRIKQKKIRALQVPFLLFSQWWTLFKLRNKYDYVHANWIIPQGIVQSYVGSKYIVTGHGGDVTSLNGSIFRIIKKRCLSKASHITVVSQKLKNILMDIYCVPEKKISIISMGCDISRFSPSLRNEEYFKKNGKKNIIFVGRLAEVKGIEYLIDSMEYIDANLYIIGTGLLEEKLRKQALKHQDKIIFLGAKSHDELPEIYASADLFVAPSITANDGAQEGFGLVIIEAMASGVPVIASRSGGIVDIVDDGKNGFLVEEKDSLGLAKKINEVLYNDELSKEIIDNGIKTAKKYDYDLIARRYAKIINRHICK